MAKRQRGASRTYQQPDGTGNVVGVAVRLFLLALLLGGMAWGVQQLLEPAQFPLRTVRIDSPLQHVAQSEIRATVEPHVKAGFLRVDVDAVRDSLESLPWVERVSVRRLWPDRLVIHVTEQQALARWGQDGLLNMRGDVFKPQHDDSWARLPLLRGPKESHRVVAEQYVAMQSQLSELGLTISHLTLDERRALSIRLANGLQLGLGRHETELRLLRFVRVFPQVIAPRLQTIESIDLRYTNGFAVRWRAGTEAAAV